MTSEKLNNTVAKLIAAKRECTRLQHALTRALAEYDDCTKDVVAILRPPKADFDVATWVRVDRGLEYLVRARQTKTGHIIEFYDHEGLNVMF